MAFVYFIIIPDKNFVLWTILLFGGIPITIQILLHLNYFIHDRKTILTIDYGKRMMIYEKNLVKTEIFFSEIKVMKRYQGSRYPDPRARYNIPSSFYHYTVIITNDNRVIRFSDFVKEEIDIYDINKKKVIVPFFNFML